MHWNKYRSQPILDKDFLIVPTHQLRVNTFLLQVLELNQVEKSGNNVVLLNKVKTTKSGKNY